MTTTTITSKGQVTIPVNIRNNLGLNFGDRIEFIYNDITGHYELIPATNSIKSLKGLVNRPAVCVSIEAMNLAIVRRGANQE